VAQRGVVVEVLVTQGQREHPLAQQRLHRVLDALRIPPVHEASRQTAGQTHRAIQIAQQQHSAVAAEHPTVERRDHLARTQSLKSELRLQTLCLKRIGTALFLILFHTK
jgi:hypothetical protein